MVKGGRATQLQDINPGIRSSNPKQFQLARTETKKGTKKVLYFSANGGERGVELWTQNISQGRAKAEQLADLYSGAPSSDPRHLTNSNEQLFFTANDGKTGRELWTLDAPLGVDDTTDPSLNNLVESSLVKNIRTNAQVPTQRSCTTIVAAFSSAPTMAAMGSSHGATKGQKIHKIIQRYQQR